MFGSNFFNRIMSTQTKMPSQMAASTLKPSKSDAAALPHRDANKLSNKGKGKADILKPTSTPIHADPWQDDSTPWNWGSLTDPSSSRIPPIFTKDGSYFFSLVGSTVKIYSSATGLVVSTLTVPSSTDENSNTDILTSAVINPQNAFQLITGTLDGRVMIWDFVNATLLQTISIGQPIHFMCAHKQFEGVVFVAASRPRKNSAANGIYEDNNAVVLQISLKISDHASQSTGIKAVGKTRFPTGLSISPNGAWLVATAGHKVYVAKTESLSSGFTKYVSPEKLTCLAFHPFEEYFATGDEKGVIRLWYCLNDNLAINVRDVEKRTQTRPFHWHAHAVSSVAFTPNGAYLLSGGEEAVLVIWQLDTGKKEFIPRLGAPISTISISRPTNGDEEYLLGLADATYTFVGSTSLNITRSYSRIKIDPAISHEPTSSTKSSVAPLAVQRLTSTLVLPSSHPSSLQMYSLSSFSLLSELEVSPSNRVSRRDDKPIIPSIVEKAVISESGQWMATVDTREGDPGFRLEVYLKIWSWDNKQENWVLNTRIDRPHGIHKVTDVSFSPSTVGGKTMHLATTGQDGRIKVLKLSNHETTRGENDAWLSYATLNFRSEIPQSVSWSPDASLFAVSVGAHIAVYDPVSRSLRQTLTAPKCGHIQSTHFIGPDGRYILCVGGNSLVVWDLIRSQVAWQSLTSEKIDRVVPHQKDATFAVFYSPDVNGDEYRTKISIFHASSSTPTSTRSVPFGLQNVVWASFQSGPGYSLVGVTYTWRVITFGDSRPILKDGGAANGINFDSQPQKKTIFQDIFGISAFTADSARPKQTTTNYRKDSNNQVFSDPVYMAPSLDSSFDSLIKSFLVVRPAEVSAMPESQEQLVEEDVEMDNDSVVPTVHTSRVPNLGEMDAFIKLFKAHCLAEPPTPPSKPIAKSTMVSSKDTTGVHQHASSEASTVMSKLRQTPRRQLAQDVVLPSPSASPLSNGKKRKKVSS